MIFGFIGFIILNLIRTKNIAAVLSFMETNLLAFIIY